MDYNIGDEKQMETLASTLESKLADYFQTTEGIDQLQEFEKFTSYSAPEISISNMKFKYGEFQFDLIAHGTHVHEYSPGDYGPSGPITIDDSTEIEYNMSVKVPVSDGVILESDIEAIDEEVLNSNINCQSTDILSVMRDEIYVDVSEWEEVDEDEDEAEFDDD